MTYAEINAVIARKYLQEKSITRAAFLKLRERFAEDWLTAFHKLEVSSTTTMSSLPEILERESLSGSDAVHLSAVVWLREQFAHSGVQPDAEKDVEFAVCDLNLVEAAEKLGVRVFNPEQ